MEELDTIAKLTTWLHQMGYSGEIPKHLTRICNPRTAFIWEQVVDSVKPRPEVRHIRNNLIINRLSVNRESDVNPISYLIQNESNYPIKEIEVWERKQTSGKKINETNCRINELEVNIEDLNRQNNAKYLILQNVQHKVIEDQQLAYLVLKKSEELNTEIAKIEDKLNLVCNLTPVTESDDKDVLVLLNQCSEKLQKLSKKQPTNTTVINGSTPKSKRNESVFFSTIKNLDDSLGLLNDQDVSETFDCESTFMDLEMLNDNSLMDIINVLLHKHNRVSVWNCLVDLNNAEKMKLLNLILESDKKLQCKVKTTTKKEGVSKLYAIHVGHALKAKKVSLNITKLRQQLSALRNLFWLNSDMSEIQTFNLKNYLNLLTKEVKLSASIQFVQAMVNSTQLSKDHKSLQIIREEGRSLQNKISLQLGSLEQKVNILMTSHKSMMKKRSETKLMMRALNKYIVDLNWISPLSSSLISNEIATLFNFPLDYNAAIRLNNEKIFLRDLHLNEFPYQELSSNKLYMLSTLVQYPWSPAEVIMLKMLDLKLKLDGLKKLFYVEDLNSDFKRYTLEELKKQEADVFRSLEKLKDLNHYISNCEIHQAVTQLQENIEFWVEMPIRNFVAGDKLYNGFPFSHFQNTYDRYYSEL